MFSGFGFTLLLLKFIYCLLIFVLGAGFGVYRSKKKNISENRKLIQDLALAQQKLIAFEQVQQAQISHVVEKVLSSHVESISQKENVSLLTSGSVQAAEVVEIQNKKVG